MVTTTGHGDVRVDSGGDLLVLENACFRRVIDLARGMPRTTSLYDKGAAFEYAAPDRDDCDFSFLGYNLPHHAKTNTSFSVTDVQATSEAGDLLMPERVIVRLEIHEAVQNLRFVREYTLFPEKPFMISRAAIRCPVHPSIYWTRRGDLYKNDNCGIAEYASVDPCVLESVMDSVKLRETPDRLQVVEFFARTDYTDTLIATHDVDPSTGSGRYNGNLCFCGLPGGHGLFFLQEAPHSNERRDFETFDFRIENDAVHSLCWGIQPHEVRGDELLWGYRHALGFFSGDAVEAARAVKQYQAHRFPRNPDRDATVMVNPWGCGRFPLLMSEPFLKDEIAAAAEVGATHYQIDDGWEQGGTLNEFTRNNRAAGADFWKIDPTVFPGGFAPLEEVARENGVELALWLAPSSSRELRDWELFADMMLAFHRKEGFRHFKFDGLRVRTKACEDNLERLLQKVRTESDGEIVIDFDVTNGQRQGFFLFQEYGLIFLANRYVCHDWGMLYHPEITLHNLWQFSRFLRPQSLQIEFCDPGIIRHDYFRGKGVTSPDEYDPEYWAALSLFGNPLLWLAPSRLESETRKTYRRVMDLHRAHRSGIFAGEISPVGPEPNGAALMGFQSHNARDGSGYLVIYRELRGPARAAVPLHFVKDERYRFTSVSDESEDVVMEAGTDKVEVEIDRPGWYRLYRYGRE